MEPYDEVALAAISIGEDPERIVRFARRRLHEAGVTPSELACALRELCRRGVRIEVPESLPAGARSVVRAAVRSNRFPSEREPDEDVG